MTRSVTVNLRANNAQFDAAYVKSATGAKVLGDEVTKSGAKSQKAMTEVGKGGVLLGGLLVAGFGLAVKSASDFNAQMSQVKTLSHATSSQLDQLRHAALTMGQAIGFSAVQAADAETELIKAGIGVSDIMGGALKGSLQLAAAGQIDVAKATEIAAIAMTQFKLAGSDIPHIADLLTAGADKALGGVGDLGEALKSGGLVAKQFGLSIEDTIGTMSAFAQAGLMGEAAGTDLRQMLLKLAAPSAGSAKTMHDLGLSIYDASGKFVGITSLAGQLHDKLGKLSEAQRNQALATIFGARAIVGANILYQNGASGIQDWIGKVDDSGFAMQQASGKMDNLKGDLSKLGAAFQTDLIDSGTTANGALRGLTQGATGLLKAFGDLPAPLQAGAIATAGLTGALTLLGGAALIAAPKIAAADAAILGLSKGSFGLTGALGRLGAGMLVVGTTVTAVDAQLTALKQGAKDAESELADLLARPDTGTEKGLAAATDQLEAFRAKTQATEGNTRSLGGIAAGVWHVFNGETARAEGALRGTDDAFGQIQAKLNTTTTNLIDMSSATGLSTTSLQALAKAAGVDLSGNIRDVTSKIVGYYNASVAGGPATEQLAASLTKMGDTAQDAASKADALKSALDALIGVHLTADQAADNYQQKLNDLSKALRGNGVSLDNLTQKGRDNKAAIRDAIQATLDLRDARAREGASEAEQRGILDAGRLKLESVAKQYGLTKAQLDKYLARLGDTPATVSTVLTLKGQEVALGKILDLNRALNGLKDRTIKVLLDPRALNNGTPVGTSSAGTPTKGNPLAGFTAHATGGLIDGPGTGTSDSILARLSTGEFVVKASAVKHNLPLLKAINDAPTFAGGGQVGYSPKGGSLYGQASAVASRGGSIDSVNALVAAYDAYLNALDQAAQREKLLGDVHDAQIAKGKANASARAAAQQTLNDAVKALASFDNAARIDKEKAATDRLIASMQKRLDTIAHTTEIQNNMYDLGKISAAQEVKNLGAQMRGLEKYSDAWTSLYKQQQQILSDQKAAAQAAADAQQAAADKAAQAQADQLAALNKLLDEQQAATDKLTAADQAYAAKKADLLVQQGKAETDFYANMGKAAADYATTVDQLLATRQNSLTSWIGAADTATRHWGSSVSWLTGNVNSQVSAFADWMVALKNARARGVSEGVISALGLDQGPQALDQLRQFTSATQAEIDGLNSAVAAKTAIAGQEAHDEQVGGYGQLGQDLVTAQQSYAAATLTLQQQFQATQADLASQLAAAQADFSAAQTQYATDLAAIGQDQGRSYAQALAAGLTSGLTAVQAAAKALGGAAAGGMSSMGGPDPLNGPNGSIYQRAADVHSAAYDAWFALHGDQAAADAYNTDADPYRQRDNGAHVSDYYDSRGVYVGPGSVMDNGQFNSGTYDDGGLLQPGLTLVNNASGHPEPVLNQQQYRDLAQGGGSGDVAVRVFIGDRELTDIVRVERETGLGARKVSSAIAGKRS
jgi:TP901 family phage tail tape measure protein